MSGGRIHQLNISKGGVPKRPLELAEVTSRGIAGDHQNQRGVHGGPFRALCLFPLELIERLQADGHPIAPGAAGENITTAGVAWDRMQPGRRLRLGSDVRIELTAFAAPCQTIAHVFSDGYFNRINERLEPGTSRVYAKVVEPGVLHPGDPIELEEAAPAGRTPTELRIDGIGQVGVRVSDLERSLAYYRGVLGLQLDEATREADSLSLVVGNVHVQLQGPGFAGDGTPPAGTLSFGVGSIEAAARALASRGVSFEAGPLPQSEQDGIEVWVAYFRDPDDNRLALVEERASSR